MTAEEKCCDYCGKAINQEFGEARCIECGEIRCAEYCITGGKLTKCVECEPS